MVKVLQVSISQISTFHFIRLQTQIHIILFNNLLPVILLLSFQLFLQSLLQKPLFIGSTYTFSAFLLNKVHSLIKSIKVRLKVFVSLCNICLFLFK